MSYMLQIWEQPAAQPFPATLADALMHLALIRQQQPRPNPKLMALAAQLQARYPALSALPGNDAEEPSPDDCAWLDQEVRSDVQETVLTLGLASAHSQEVQPFVVQTAITLGLCLLDEQAGALILPNRRVLLADGRNLPLDDWLAPGQAPSPAAEELPKAKQALQGIAAALAPALKTHGFSLRKGATTLIRKFPGGRQEIEIDVLSDSWPHDFRLSVACTLHLDAVTLLIQTARGEASSGESSWCAIAQHRQWMRRNRPACFQPPFDGYHIEHPAQIDEVIDNLRINLTEQLLPLLALGETLEGMDRLLNLAPPEEAVFQGPLSDAIELLVAWRCANPRLPAIIAAVEAKTRVNYFPRALAALAYVKAQIAV